MVFDTTYRNDEYDEQSDRLLGESFRFFEKIRMGGVGSARFVVASLSPKLDLGKLKFSETDYGNIELRPKGIIVRFRSLLETYGLIIPYYKLKIYKGRAKIYSIYMDNYFIKVIYDNDSVREFFKKILDQKILNIPSSFEDI